MTLHANVLIVIGVASASLLGGYGARRLYLGHATTDRVATDRVATSPAPVGGATEPDALPAVADHAADDAATAQAPAVAPPRLRHLANAGDRNLLVSREDVDRDFNAGVSTNGAASRLVAQIEQRLNGATDDVVVEDCFERASLPVPRSLMVALDIRSTADAVELVRLEVDGPSQAVQDCVRALVGTVRLPRMPPEPPYLDRDGTVQVDQALAQDR